MQEKQNVYILIYIYVYLNVSNETNKNSIKEWYLKETQVVANIIYIKGMHISLVFWV